MKKEIKTDKYCPECGNEGNTHIHQKDGFVFGVPAHIIDMGWKCSKCQYEWGFEEKNNG
jgi:hypothetical protein